MKERKPVPIQRGGVRSVDGASVNWTSERADGESGEINSAAEVVVF